MVITFECLEIIHRQKSTVPHNPGKQIEINEGIRYGEGAGAARKMNIKKASAELRLLVMQGLLAVI
jgi:hypothetical protein